MAGFFFGVGLIALLLSGAVRSQDALRPSAQVAPQDLVLRAQARQFADYANAVDNWAEANPGSPTPFPCVAPATLALPPGFQVPASWACVTSGVSPEQVWVYGVLPAGAPVPVGADTGGLVGLNVGGTLVTPGQGNTGISMPAGRFIPNGATVSLENIQ
ncbi:MAG: type IV pilus biogenesis protein PilM [Acidiferrobacteraceae bacterium]